MSMRPTYRQLADYGQLMPLASNERQLKVAGASLKDTVRLIRQVMAAEGAKMARIAAHLKGEGPHNDRQHAFNVWHYTRSHLKYSLDPTNWEDVRTPARSWMDRQRGVDCEDYSLFMASIMQAMGYGPRMAFAIVALEAPGQYGHIYPVLMPRPVADATYNGQPGGMAMDRLLAFDTHPQNIKTTMQLALLSGVGDDAKRKWLQSTPPEDRQLVAEMLPYVERITAGGAIVWRPGAPVPEIADMAADHTLEKEGGLSGLGAIGRFRNRPPARPRKPVKAVPAAIARVTPIMIVGRGAFLMLVKLNAFKLARLLRLAFLPEDVAKRSRLNLTEWRKLRARRDKIVDTWKQLGGKEGDLKAAIAKGASVKVQSLAAIDPVTATAVVGAVPVIAAVAAALGKDHDLKKMTEGSEEADLAALGASVGDSIGKIAEVAKKRKDRKDKDGKGGGDAALEERTVDAATPADPGGDGGGDDKTRREPTEEKSNTTLYVVGGLLAAAGIGGALYFSSTTQKPK